MMLKIGLRKKVLWSKIFKFFSTLFAFVFIAIFYCEYLHYYIVIYKCKWPDVQGSGLSHDKTLHVMSVADTHLLGRKNGHWFDKLRREWQMHRAFQTTVAIHNPEVVIFLGDLFDEGKWCNDEEFKQYIQRFHALFYVAPEVEILVAAGNHDIGFHYSVNPYLTNRFEKAFKAPAVYMKSIKNVTFIAINSMAMQGDDCFLCKPARLKIESISRTLRCLQGSSEECKGVPHQGNQYSQPILLQHYPLYRESDALCSEPDEAPSDEKYIKFREKWECLSKESSDMLLRELQPRLVLSGHTHHGCKVIHSYDVRNSSHTVTKSVTEFTIPSFSWRNKKNPTFAMVSVNSGDYSFYKCQMPDENTVYLLYTLFTVIFITFSCVRKLLRFHFKKFKNFLYFKCEKKS